MKNWIGRLFGGEEKTETKAPATSAATPVAAVQVDQVELQAKIDAAYYRWLIGSAGGVSSRETETRIIEELAKLGEDPEQAGGLVPRVPELVTRLLTALSDENISTATLSAEVGQDLMLVAEVIREANSAYYRPLTPIETLEGAVTMLGLNGLRMLLARIAFRPLVKLDVEGVARQLAPRVWSHSERCAFASSVMAPGLSAAVFEAFLAGLMQNVGLQVAFRVCERVGVSGKVPSSAAFGAELFKASRELSAIIARHWEFPDEVVEAIAEGSYEMDAEHDISNLAQALAQGDRIAKLRLLLDAENIGEDNPLVVQGMNQFQRRCLNKLADLNN